MGAEHHWEITGTIHVFYCQNSPRFFSSLSKYFTNYFSLLKTRTNKRWLSTGTSKSPFTASSVHGLKNTNFCYLHASFFLLLLFKILKQPFFKGAECYVATADLYMEKKKRLYFPSPIWVFLLCLHSWLRADWPESSEEGRADLGNFLLRLPMLLLSVLQFWHGRPSPLSGTARPLWFQLFEQLYSLLDCWISFFFQRHRDIQEKIPSDQNHTRQIDYS